MFACAINTSSSQMLFHCHCHIQCKTKSEYLILRNCLFYNSRCRLISWFFTVNSRNLCFCIDGDQNISFKFLLTTSAKSYRNSDSENDVSDYLGLSTPSWTQLISHHLVKHLSSLLLIRIYKRKYYNRLLRVVLFLDLLTL